MGSLCWQIGICIWVFLFGFIWVFQDSNIENGAVSIDGESGIAEIDTDFICATMDWWPPEKCDYGTCSWDNASLLNVDLSNKIFQNAVKAFSPLKIRLGGSLQDVLVYETEDHIKPCTPFTQNTSALFGFNEGCLPLSRWDELNSFFNETGEVLADGSTVGPWDSTNAESLMRNELSGSGVGARVTASQYAIDTTLLKNVVHEIYDGIEPKPRIISPGGFFDAKWFKEFINKTNEILDVVTHHIYNLGPGVDQGLVEKILDPSYLDGEADTFKQLKNILATSETSASAWVGEAGGAYNSGHNLVTNAFVFSGNYGLLNTTTFEPNPDYYSALLWHQLMGKTVLATNFSGTKKMRSYAHCAKKSDGITLLLINLDTTTTVNVTLTINSLLKSWGHDNHLRQPHTRKGIRMVRQDTKTGESAIREEYHLTAKDGNLHSQTMVLNGKELTVNEAGDIPPLEPLNVSISEPITVTPNSIVFAHIPSLTLNACGNVAMEL
ncbi:hypothetical protein Ccrd_009897 [Cynara cardunculus var. scolymus]|uniref:Glycoside hydrolase, family 79 n=1 Tax=Cynara cardunculus var. scolymus TaxID=59895 RepID=A0A103YMC8_CYNCS|nr:hypothetical protein Ccrd_009897 [Cynara cardunculus var. scolymus]